MLKTYKTVPESLPAQTSSKKTSIEWVVIGLTVLLLPGLFYAYWAAGLYEIIDTGFINDFFPGFIALYALLIGTLLWKTRSRTDAVYRSGRRGIFLYFLGPFISLFVIFYGTIGLVDGAFDTSAPRAVESVVFKKWEDTYKKRTTYYVRFAHWDDPRRELTKTVSADVYNQVQVDKTRIAAQVKKGWLGYEYYVEDTFRVITDAEKRP